MKLSENQVLAIKRKRGEKDYSIHDLADIFGCSWWTMNNIIRHNHRNVRPITFKRINDWLIDEMVKDGE